MFTCLIRAHLTSQVRLVKYFGGNNMVDDESEVELARCILQSQLTVYKAIQKTVVETNGLDKILLKELVWIHNRKSVAEHLISFVMSAHGDGAISAREAASIVHPLEHQVSKCVSSIDNTTDGILVSAGGRRHASRSSANIG